ncbi:MAG: lectin like domain-containing protein [Lentisphaeria bacterium]|jgi:C1A family cysteine protease|nr:lectin like domain-containing protein [Lentisphaeria bacterium]
MAATQSRAFVAVRLLGVVMLWLGLAGWAEEPAPSLAPLNPEFFAYQARLAELARSGSRIGGDGRFGHRPAPVDLSHLAAQVTVERDGASARELPASFDWRTAEPGKLSPVRNQNPYNTCWTFATYASLESWLRPAETPDYSERHLAHTHGLDLGYDDGGNQWISASYLARWSGPVAEADCPYTGMPTAPSGTYTVRKRVQEVLFYPSPLPANSAVMDVIKGSIMANGALYVAYYHSDTYYKSANRAYYNPVNIDTNHGVSVVGWDDDFAAAKFASTPPGNGAWILRNSWGTGWGDGGYFYLSYYDTSFQSCTPALYTAAAEAENYDHLHQHDPLGWIGSFGYGSPTNVWGANVFALDDDEVLKAVAFYTAGRNVAYEVRVYRSLASASPSSGTLCGIGSEGATVVSGTFAEAGYHTVVLPTAVLLEAPQNFSVVVKLADPVSPFPVAMEYAISNYSSAATASPNQSFYSSNGSNWTDLTQFRSTANFCIKAFTDDPPPEIDVLGGAPLQSIPAGSASLSAADGTLYDPVAVGGSLAHTFTIRNTGAGNLLLTGSPLVGIGGGEAGDFAVTAQPDSLVAAGGSTTFAVTFSPSGLGPRTTTVSIASNDSDESPYTFALQGVGGNPPVAVDDGYDAVRNMPLVVAAPGVLANDDGDGAALTAVKISDPANGTLSLHADGSFSYTSLAGFSGTDSFTYRASNGALQSDVATVTIEVAKPTVTLDVNENGSANFADLRLIYQQIILGIDQTEPTKSNIEDLSSRLDVNENGSTNFADLRLVYQQVILGIDQTEPAQTNIQNLLP